MLYNPSISSYSSTSSTQKLSFFEYFFVLVLIIYAAHANRFVVSFSIIENPIWFSVPIILSGILFLKWGCVFNKQFYLLILGFFLYFFAISVKYHEIRPTFFLNYVLLFFITYATVKALKVNLFRIFEFLLFYLAIVGLVMWAIQIILGGDTLYNYFGRIPSIDTFSYVSGNGLNAIFYSVQPTTMSLQFDFLPPRNCGFAWEPGGFAALLCLAIFINIYLYESDRKSKIRFWILLAALISTQSTTGYTIFTLMIIFYYLNKRLSVILVLMPVVITIIIIVFSLPFMSDKIVSLANETSQIDIMVEGSIGMDSSINPQRFASFLIAFRDFLNNPVLGLGGNAEASWTYKIGANVSAITGIGNILAQFGIVGFLFFIISLYQTSLFFSKTFRYYGKFLFFLIVLFISISYGIVLLPLLMSFWMFKLFTPFGINEDDIPNQGLNTKYRMKNPDIIP
jgi:hypothetical protein